MIPEEKTNLGKQTAGGERVSLGTRLLAKAPTQAGCGFSAMIVTYAARRNLFCKGDEIARSVARDDAIVEYAVHL